MALCARAQAGDVQARNRLVAASLGLVYSRARPWHRSMRHGTIEDLAAEGVLGLITAIEKFDASRGAAFATYATLLIDQAIRHAMTADGDRRLSDDNRHERRAARARNR